ncbi:hypothetical protein C8J55DRAFT_566936 [Lentinula edodes]|uniref:Uncharacterized protein n=1 Tax=Lentinula lateritia TaxID=40482 RepID=A0A9W9DD74_9AGAR|nr:hypothetical protein C8J55DRAFT_566936 [Lentinula edodes]
MAAPICRSNSRTPSPPLPTLTTLGEVPSPGLDSNGETVFNTGKPLSGYCQDNPLWPLLAEVASPCSNCLKSPGKCKVLPNSPRCTTGLRKRLVVWGRSSGIGILLVAAIRISHIARQYDAALHTRTSLTSTLLELNMLDERDTADADQQELQKFLALQQGEAVVVAKRKRDRSPLPMASPSSKRVQSDTSKKCSRRRSPVEEAVQESPLRVQLVVPPGRSVAASTSTPAPPCASPSLMEVPGGDLPSGLVQQPVVPPATRTPIKGTGPDLLSSNMPPTPRPTLREVKQLRSSSHEVLEDEMEYRCVLDQFVALDEALLGTPGQSLLERFRKVQKDLRDATREHKIAQQGLVDESNALATRQHRLVEELQEELHRARDHAAFVQQMVKEYPDEGYYEVVLPPLSQLEGDLNKAHEDLRRVATFAHRLHCSDPATVLHHHHRYIGAIIEAVVAFLRRGLDSEDLDAVVYNFRLALDFMQAAQGVHGDLYM